MYHQIHLKKQPKFKSVLPLFIIVSSVISLNMKTASGMEDKASKDKFDITLSGSEDPEGPVTLTSPDRFIELSKTDQVVLMKNGDWQTYQEVRNKGAVEDIIYYHQVEDQLSAVKEFGCDLALKQTLNSLNQMKVGDTFIADISYDLEWNEDEGLQLMRAISTYGYEDIPASSGILYKVQDIAYKQVPHAKGSGVSKDPVKMMIVREQSSSMTENCVHYWYINLETGGIEQFEDGHELALVLNVFVAQ